MTGDPPARSVPGRGRLCSVRGTELSGRKPASWSSPSSCLSVRKHCGSPENSVKTKCSPATGSIPSASVVLENVKTKSPAPGLATRAASRTAPRNCAADRARFQMPCAMTRSTESDPSGRCSMGAITRFRLPAGRSARARPAAASSIGPDRFDPDDVPAEAGERNRVAASPAADVERAHGAAFALPGSEPYQRRI